MKKHEEERLNELMKEASRDILSTKEEIWVKIDQRVQAEKQGNHGGKRKRKWTAWMVPVAAGLLLTFGATTEQGKAFVDELKAMFVPEKPVSISIEGESETHVGKVGVNEAARFALYVDESRYNQKMNGKTMTISFKEQGGASLPPVTMVLEDKGNVMADELQESIVQQAGSRVMMTEEVSTPVKGKMIVIQHGHEWNSPVEKVYIIDRGEKGTFLITQSLFVEAMEGHGARFDEMLNTLEFVD